MKPRLFSILLIGAAFICGLAWNSRAADECGFVCSPYSTVSTKPFLADAGFTSTQPAFFSGNLYAWRGSNSLSIDENTANMQGGSGRSAIVMDFEGAGKTSIGSLFENGNATYLTVDDVNQVITITNMPTSDPHIVNALYSVDGVLHISNGQ